MKWKTWSLGLEILKRVKDSNLGIRYFFDIYRKREELAGSMKVGKQGIELIKHFEGLHDGDLRKIGLQPKECPAGIWTIGYGRALKDEKGEWLKGPEGFKKLLKLYPHFETITEEKAVQFLEEDLNEYGERVKSLNLPLSQHEFDALVSFSYNVGFGALQRSTLLKRIQSREGNIEEAFMMWVKGGGKTLPGLVRRRKAEATLFLTGKLEL